MTDQPAPVALAKAVNAAISAAETHLHELTEVRRQTAITLHYDCGWSQAAIAAYFGVSRAAVGQWMSGY